MSRLTRTCLSAAAALGLAGFAPAAAQADPAAPAPPVTVRITSFSPVAPKPGDTVTISGTATNTGTTLLNRPQAIACAQPGRIGDRAALAALPPDGDSCKGLAGAESTAYHDFAEALEPGVAKPFKITVPWEQWELGNRNGVYVVGVRIFANDPDGNRLTRAIARTLMPVVAAGAKTREVRTAMVVPLRHRPTQLGGTYFSDESLLEAMDPEQGRLSRLLQAGSKQKVSWLVDPSLVDEARVLAQGYRTDGSAGVQPEPSPVARDWLTKLGATIGDDPVVRLPYADPDVRALTDAGFGRLVTRARELSAATTAAPSIWGAKSAATGFWLDGPTPEMLAAAADPKPADVTLLPTFAWPAGQNPLVRVSTPRGDLRTVIADQNLTAGGPDPIAGNTPVQLRQRLAAETALLALAGSAAPATIAVLPGRQFDIAGTATATLLQALSLPWVNPIGLDQLGEPTRTITAPETKPAAPVVTGQRLKAVLQLDYDDTTLQELLAVPDSGRAQLDRAKLRTASLSWRGAPAEGDRFRRYQLGALRNQFEKVRILSTDGPDDSVVTLSASKGRFPLTVANDLDRPVRVGLRIESLNRDDLKVEPVEVARIRGGNRETFEIRASAQQNGLIKARVHIVTDSGRELGQPLELDIRAAQYGTVGWVLVASAVALLFGTSAIRIYRRIRSERRAAARTASAPEGATAAALAGTVTATAQAGKGSDG